MSHKARTMILAAAAVATFALPALAESNLCTVKASEIRLRKSPSKKGKVVAVLKKDARVTTTQSCSGGWVKVASEDGRLAGYVGGWALAAASAETQGSTPQPKAEVKEAPTAAGNEVPTNEKLAIQITELRLNVLGIQRDMQQMKKDVQKIKMAMKRKGAAKKVAQNVKGHKKG